MMKTKVKEKKLGAYIKELDGLVSLFVRLSAADDQGTVSCISCGERLWWADSDCCHYKDRDNMGTRFYLPNLAPGCQPCNRFSHYDHITEWKRKLTNRQQNDLEFRSRSLMKFTRTELEEMIEDYKVKVAALRKQKNL